MRRPVNNGNPEKKDHRKKKRNENVNSNIKSTGLTGADP